MEDRFSLTTLLTERFTLTILCALQVDRVHMGAEDLSNHKKRPQKSILANLSEIVKILCKKEPVL